MAEAGNGGLVTSSVLGKALGVSFQCILDEHGRRQLVFQTHIDQDDPLEKLNAILDRLRAAVERQQAMSELADLDRKIDGEMLNFPLFVEAAEKIEAQNRLMWEESGRKGPYDPEKLPPKLRGARQQAKDSLERSGNAIKLWRKRREELKRIIGYVTTGATDNLPGVLHGESAGNDGASRAET